jgi:hypothetical protein
MAIDSAAALGLIIIHAASDLIMIGKHINVFTAFYLYILTVVWH